MKHRAMLKKIRNIVGHIFTLLLILLLCFNLYNFIAVRFFGVEAPSVLGISNAVVASGSMSGTLEVNDMVIIQRKQDYSTGDVITFKYQGSLVTHRIVGVTDEGFTTKGDANNAGDREPVSREATVGKVILVIPKIGRIFEILRSPLGMTALMLAIFLLIQLPAIWGALSKSKSKAVNENCDRGGVLDG